MSEQDVLEKKSAFVSYDGNDEKIKMISNAVNNLTEDVRHDSVTFEETPRNYYLRDGDINFSVKEAGAGEPTLYLYRSVYEGQDDIDYYEERTGKRFPIRFLGDDIYHVDGANRWNNYYQRTCVTFPINGLQAGSLYTISFNALPNPYLDDCFRSDPTYPSRFGIVVHDKSEIDFKYTDGDSPSDYYKEEVVNNNYISNEVYGSYYPSLQYYSFFRNPPSHTSHNVEFTFIAYDTTYISFILNDLLSSQELIDKLGESIYNSWIKNHSLIDIYDFDISNFTGRNNGSVIDKIYGYSVNSKKWISSESHQVDRLFGTSIPDSSLGVNGDYYIQYSFSEASDFTVSAKESYGFVSNTIRKDTSGYYLASSYDTDLFNGNPAYMEYSISGLTKLASYLFTYTITKTDTKSPEDEGYCNVYSSIGPYDFEETTSAHPFDREVSIVAYDTAIAMRLQSDWGRFSEGSVSIEISNLKAYKYGIQDIWYKIEGAWHKYEASGGGGADVSITPIQLSGTQIASYTIGENVSGILYAPTPPSISPNPQTSVTTDLEKIEINGTTYGLTSVNANPPGSATGDLEKIEINGVIYELTPASSINGVPLVGNKTSSDLGITITKSWLDYLALPDEEKYDPNKTYYIPDYGARRGAGYPITIFSKNDPTSQQGNDGDVYLKYTDTHGISAIFGKVEGTWLKYCPFLEFDWDFTKSLYSYNNGTAVTLSNATRSTSGITFSGSNNYVSLPAYLIQFGFTYEFHITSLSMSNTSNNNRFFVYTDTEQHNAGFAWRGATGKWGIWDSNILWQESTITDCNFWSDSVMKIKIDNLGKWHFYKDDVVVFEPDTPLTLKNTELAIGAKTNGCYRMTISRFRIYPNDD